MRGARLARPRFSRTASTRLSSYGAFMAFHGESTRVEFVPFGVDAQAFAPSVEPPSTDVVIGRVRTRIATSSCSSRSRRRRPSKSFRLVTTRRSRARARLASAERRGRGRHPVRRDATTARGGPRRRASRSREQLLGGDDRAPAGDGAREAGRRHAHAGRSRAATGSSTARTAVSSSRATRRASSARSPRCSATSGTRARSARARADDRRGEPHAGIATSTGSRRFCAPHAEHPRVAALGPREPCVGEMTLRSRSSPHGAHGCVATNTSSTVSQAAIGVPRIDVHSAPSMFSFTTSARAATVGPSRMRARTSASRATRTRCVPTSCSANALRRLERVAPRSAPSRAARRRPPVGPPRRARAPSRCPERVRRLALRSRNASVGVLRLVRDDRRSRRRASA